jgi:xylulokinase
MLVLAIDVGSSSVKAAILRNRRVIGRIARAAFATHYDNDRVEVNADAVLHAVAGGIGQLGARARRVDVIAISAMAPSWLAMDRRGRAITPLVTHQDRRSVDVARALEKRVGRSRHLALAGNRPFPGGISSTTWRWFNEKQPRVMRRADLVGHVQTFLHRQLNGARAADPSNASYMGVYATCKLDGWSDELCEAVGASAHQLPQLIDAEGVVGMVNRAAGERFRLTHGTPMLCGCIDTSAAMFLAGAKPGRVVNITGSTDVLAVCTDKPRPHEQLLTRALGIGRLWVSASTLAAARSSLSWAKDQLFADLSVDRFFQIVEELADVSRAESGDVVFEPYLAGERTSIEQRRGAFSGLTLATTRRQMLAAVIESLARSSAQRLKLIATNRVKLRRDVQISDGASSLSRVFRRDWPGRWKFHREPEATLRGLAALADG